MCVGVCEELFNNTGSVLTGLHMLMCDVVTPIAGPPPPTTMGARPLYTSKHAEVCTFFYAPARPFLASLRCEVCMYVSCQ